MSTERTSFSSSPSPPEVQELATSYGSDDPIETTTITNHHKLEIPTSTTEETNGRDINHDHNQDKQEEDDGDDEGHYNNISILQRLSKYICSHDGKELGMVLVIAFTIFGFGHVIGDPLQRPIPYQYIESTGTYVLNANLNLHSDGDTFSDFFVAALACLVCPIVQFTLTFCTTTTRWIDAHRTICVYLMTLATNDILTWTLKSYMGIQRPNFYQACDPNETYEYCNNTEGEKGQFEFGGSFPSGHASYTFCSLTLLYLYLERTFGVTSIQQMVLLVEQPPPTNNIMMDENDDDDQEQGGVPTRTTGRRVIGLEYTRNYPLVYRFISILCSLPLILGAFMTASRVVDNQHHPSDIVAGTLMGVFIGYFFHSIWFPDPRLAAIEKPSYAR